MLSQTQIIRSLGEALGLLEKELDWGAPLAELRHLTGRIGELYAAMLTRGQMAGAVNQRGYDVLRADFDHHLRFIANGEVDFPIRPPRTPRARRGRSGDPRRGRS